MSYTDDRRWSDRFIPLIKQIVGPHLLVPSTFEQDTKEASDLVVLRARDMMVACRVRRSGYIHYSGQFTIRCERTTGAKTELEKIVNGWGDWMFYAHSNEEEDGFAIWYLLDLSAWRAHLIRDKGSIVRGIKDNCDGTKFAWFDISSFGPNPPLVIAKELTPTPF